MRRLSITLAVALAFRPGLAQTPYQLYGIDFNPYLGSQSPGSQISPAQIQQLLNIVAPYTLWVRTYSSLNGLDKVCPMAHAMGLKCAAGAAIYGSSTDSQEVSALIENAQAGNVDLAIVGTEALFRGNVPASTLVTDIQQFRNAVPGVPVTTADTYQALLDNEGTILPAVDQVLFDIYPFFEGIPLDHAISYINGWYQLMQNVAGTKPVIIAETGWPTSGQNVGKAIPSVANASAYFLDFVSWARANNASYFYFEAFDEPWKSAENSEGPYFGIWDSSQILKPENLAFFLKETLPDNWSGDHVPGGDGTPQISLTYVPPYGSTTSRVFGQALHVRPADYKIACYIESTNNVWYVKPDASRPLTPILDDGSWACDSELNIAFAAFLLPNGSVPPVNLHGDPPMPPANSVASAEVQRSLYSISGTVTDTEGHAVDRATVSVTGAVTESTQTADGGQYSFLNLTSGGNYVVTASAAGVNFQPSSQTFSNLSTGMTASFVASLDPPLALQFVPISPCRLADTRTTGGPFGGPAIAGGLTRDFVVPLGGCNVPTGALAYALNVTVVPQGSLGYLTIWGTGQAQPFVSTMNSDGRIKANAAIVDAGQDGEVTVYVTDPSDVVLDISGYFVSAGTYGGTELAFFPVAPCRISDTRFSGGSLAAGETRSMQIANTCLIPASAQAYSLNVTAVPRAKLGYLTIWPDGEAQPFVSTLNATTGAVTANAAIVPAGAAGVSGAISLYASDDTDVILDVNGYFAPPATGGLSLYTTTPCRVLDTRSSSGVFNGVLAVPVEASPCGVPAAAQAYVMNATVVPPGPLTYLALWSDGTAQPYVSTLNAVDGAITSNMAVVPTANGSVDAFSSRPSQLILDVSSYFAP